MTNQLPQLNDRFTVFVKQEIPDDFGGMDLVWRETEKIWASCIPSSTKEISSRSLAQIVQFADCMRQNVYQIHYRQQVKLPMACRLKNADTYVQVISDPVMEKGYAYVYAIAVRTYSKGEET